MTATELLTRFADPSIVQTLSITDKMTAGLITTLLGMGITFAALIILQFIISWMDKIINRSRTKQTNAEPAAPSPPPTPAIKIEPYQDHNELVAVIAGVIAMKLKTSVGNIVIKNIEKVEDHSPAWNRAGIFEQMSSRL